MTFAINRRKCHYKFPFCFLNTSLMRASLLYTFLAILYRFLVIRLFHKTQILEINIAQSGFLVLGSIETNMSPSLRTERPHSPIVISMGNQAKSKIRS